MHQSVIDFFPAFSKKLEGCVDHMYLDCLGLVTTGIGCLIDPVALAVTLPWVLKGTDTKATTQQIIDEWHRIKDDVRLAKLHYKYAGALCQLRLTEQGVQQLLEKRMLGFEEDLKKEFPDWEEWPADAQLGVMSMSWAMGSGFTHRWPGFVSACQCHMWLNAAESCHINEKGNPGIIPRNKANKILFEQAALGYGPTKIEEYDRTQVSKSAIGYA